MISAGAARSQRGIAIVAALWGAALLAIMVFSILKIVLADAQVGRGQEDVAQLNGIADAAVNITILALLGPRATQPAVNGVPFPVLFAGRTARVVVQDEAGKIDLNMADDATLLQLLLAAGLDTGPAADMANRIIAWRGPNLDNRYGDAGSAAHGELFQSVEELQQIAGMTPELYRRIAPLVTVYSQTPGIDPAFSNSSVLNVFRAIDPIAEAVWRRMEEERAGLRPPEPSPGVALGHAFTITAEVDGTPPARVVRTATIRLTGQKQQPLLIYRWN